MATTLGGARDIEAEASGTDIVVSWTPPKNNDDVAVSHYVVHEVWSGRDMVVPKGQTSFVFPAIQAGNTIYVETVYSNGQRVMSVGYADVLLGSVALRIEWQVLSVTYAGIDVAKIIRRLVNTDTEQVENMQTKFLPLRDYKKYKKDKVPMSLIWQAAATKEDLDTLIADMRALGTTPQ